MNIKEKLARKAKQLSGKALVVRHGLSRQPVDTVMWLSHHIPKTAGSSFHSALLGAYGAEGVCQAGFYGDYAVRLSRGEHVWVPAAAKVIHGHFKPHINHLTQFPSAQRITWIRDPVSRVISLLNNIDHRTMNHVHFEGFKRQFPKDQFPFEERLERFITAPQLFRETRIYEAFAGMSKEDFAFVGRTENYNADILRLQDLMDLPLPVVHLNASPKRPDTDIDRRRFEVMLGSEYDIFNRFL